MTLGGSTISVFGVKERIKRSDVVVHGNRVVGFIWGLGGCRDGDVRSEVVDQKTGTEGHCRKTCRKG